jgi:hypothetical protein
MAIPVEGHGSARRFSDVANRIRTSGGNRVRSCTIEVDADARHLRESLRRLSGLWRLLEPGTAQRARHLLTQVVSRASDPRRAARGPIRVRLRILATAARIEVTGPGLHAPHEGSATDDPPFPIWIVEDLAERWGIGPGEDTLWFEIDRVPGDTTEQVPTPAD